jgi:hypothetical protein
MARNGAYRFGIPQPLTAGPRLSAVRISSPARVAADLGWIWPFWPVSGRSGPQLFLFLKYPVILIVSVNFEIK